MRHDHTPSVFDLETEERDDALDDQFWGATRSWGSREHAALDGSPPSRRDDTTGSLRAIRAGFAAFRPTVRADATGEIARTRQHGAVDAQRVVVPTVPTREPTLGELASGWFDDDDDWSIPGDDTVPVDRVDLGDDALVPLSETEPIVGRLGLGAVDPLVLRVGAMLTALVLLVPLALSLRPNDAGAIESDPSAAIPAAGAAPDAQPLVETSPTEAAPAGQPAAEATGVVDEVTTAAAVEIAPQTDVEVPTPTEAPATETAPPATAEAVEAVGDAAQAETVDDDAATVAAVAERQMPECPQTYEAGAGDSWYRIADAAGVTPSALLAENRATVDTVIFPGDEICLPAGATMPSPPTTVAPPTTAPATTAPPTTQAPTTTQAPSTTTPASTSEVQQIIRDVWPDELEEKALQIAYRESRYVATAYNGWCCYGVFQIYWTVHQSWLDDYGIYTSSDLFDARKNTEAAYALYRAAGGWGPWGG